MSADAPWTGPDKTIRKVFRSAPSYDIIDGHGLGDTWSSGGCWVAAEAIKRRFGGELRGIWDGRAGLTHVVAEKRGVMIDADGKPLPRAAFLKRYAKQEHLTPPVYVEPFRESDAERNGIVFSPDAVDEAVALLGGARANPQRPSVVELFSREAQAEAASAPRYKSRERVVFLPIADFLLLAADIGAGDPDKLAGVADAIARGTPLRDLPLLRFGRQGKIQAHEGRHRALILRKLGYQHMPVVLKSDTIRWSEQNDPKSFDYVAQWPSHLVGEGDKTTRVPFPVTREGAALPATQRNPRRDCPARLTFINPADVITTPKGYFVKKAALKKIQREMYAKTGEWLGLDELEGVVNKMLAVAAQKQFTIVQGRKRRHG